MTVAEFIEILKTFPQNAQVVSENDRSDITIVEKDDVVYDDNGERELKGDFLSPRSFWKSGMKERYFGPYVEISGCVTW